MQNVKIISIEASYPKNVVLNNYYISHFKKMGKNIEGMLESFGRNERKVIKDKHENTVTLGIHAAIKALESANLKGKDIDLIIFSSQFPQYTCPSQALILHNGIRGKKDTMVMDSNVNCIGMLESLDVATQYLLRKKKFKRALVVGADYITIHCNENDELTYPVFGDCGCAIVLEKTDDECGIIDTDYRINSDEFSMVQYPACGVSNIYKQIDMNKKKICWKPFDGNHIISQAKESIENLLKENNLDISQIKAFCISQYSLSLLKGCAEALGVSEDKFIYVGDKYGYTGTSSPFLALYNGIKQRRIQRGDYIIFWSIAIQWTTCAILYKY